LYGSEPWLVILLQKVTGAWKQYAQGSTINHAVSSHHKHNVPSWLHRASIIFNTLISN